MTTPNPEVLLSLVDLKDVASIRLIRSVVEGHLARLDAEVASLKTLNKQLAAHEQGLKG